MKRPKVSVTTRKKTIRSKPLTVPIRIKTTKTKVKIPKQPIRIKTIKTKVKIPKHPIRIKTIKTRVTVRPSPKSDLGLTGAAQGVWGGRLPRA
jgi:hypothetical protein